MQELAPFSSVLGIAPTEDAAVVRTVEIVSAVRQNVVALVDGDPAGDGYAEELAGTAIPPRATVQWPAHHTIEDMVGWILCADEGSSLATTQAEFGGTWTFGSIGELISILKTRNDKPKGIVGLKEDSVAHEVLAGVIHESTKCRGRCAALLDALVAASSSSPHALIVSTLTNPRRYRVIAA